MSEMKFDWRKAVNYAVFTSAVLVSFYLLKEQVCPANHDSKTYTAKKDVLSGKDSHISKESDIIRIVAE